MSIAKNSTFNLIGALLPLAISLVTIPVYLELIGEERYGILAIAWLLLGYFGFFDLGLGRATAQRIGSLRSHTVEQRAEVFWSALLVNIGLGLIAAAIIWPVAHYVFSNVMKIDSNLRSEVIAAVPWLALSMPFATLTGVLTGALIGREEFLELNIISVVGTALFQTLPLVAVAVWGADLRIILPVALLSRVITLMALYSRCLHHVCQRHRFVFRKKEAIQLLKFGGWVTVSSIVGPMMVVLDRMIIGAVSGARVVTIYTIPFQFAERTGVIGRSLSGALFPRLSGLDDKERSLLAQKSQRALIGIMTPFSAVAIVVAEPFLSFWISPEFGQDAAIVGIIVLVGFWVNCFAVIPQALIQARGRPDFIAKVHLAELLPYFLMLYIGLIFLGFPGAAIAFSIRSTIDFVALAWLAGQLRTTMHDLVIPGVTISTLVLIVFTAEVGSTVWFALSVLIISISVFRGWITLPEGFKSKLRSLIGWRKRNSGRS